MGSEELGRHETSSLTDRQSGKALFELGETRALTVRNYLAATHAIAESRMLICSPRIDFKKNTSAASSLKSKRGVRFKRVGNSLYISNVDWGSEMLMDALY